MKYYPTASLLLFLSMNSSCYASGSRTRRPIDRANNEGSSTDFSAFQFNDNIFGGAELLQDLTPRQQEGQIIIPSWGHPYQFGGEAGVDFLYQGVGYNFGTPGSADGLSYYLRAFDLYPGVYGNELGWGQWIAPRAQNPPGTPCSLNPRALACYNREDPRLASLFEKEGNWANYDVEYKDCSWPEGDSRLLNCKLKNCGQSTSANSVYGSFEGGMGYWPYMTEAKGVKWMVPAAVSGYYHKYGSTFQPTFHQLSTHMGGSIQVSNNILLAPDGYSFEPNDNGAVDGMVGYMLQNTPIGKMHPDDNRNFWTIIADTENFAGPLMFASPYHWEHPNSWRPEIKTWADPKIKIGYAAEGTEGRVATVGVEKDGYFYFRMQDTEIHLDDNEDATTVTTGHVQYVRNWAEDVLEPILDGTTSNASPADVRAASRDARTKPRCPVRGQRYDEWGSYFISGVCGDPDSPLYYTVRGWGVGDDQIVGSAEEADDDWCHAKVPVETASPYLTCSNRKCRLTPYYKLPTDGSSEEGELIAESDIPSDIKNALDNRANDLWPAVARQNEGDNMDGPDEDQKACFDKPGPADPTLYCRRTTDERWLAYKWYRFVDQPEMNQVIASLPEEEQEETKCFMQARIERLHEMQAKEQNPRWFDPPTGELPTKKATIDQGFIVTPPPGFEIGYVPVSMYTKLRVQPTNCDVVEGAFSTEPNPLPSDYYADDVSFFNVNSGYGRNPQMCFATDESGSDYEVPGTLFFSKRDGSGEKFTYRVPLREEVGNFVPEAYDAGQCARNGFGGSIPAPSAAPTPGFACFSEFVTVEVRDRGMVSMKDLRIGDHALVSSDMYEPIYSFGHLNEDAEAEFLKIVTSSSMVPLEITKDHMLFVNGQAAPASLVKIGDQLSLKDTGVTIAVTKIESVVRKGVYAPFTPSGTIVVNGILASTFMAFQESSYLHVGGVRTPLSYQWLAHTFEIPHRSICALAGSSWCEKEWYSSCGVSVWVYLPLKVTECIFGCGSSSLSAIVLLISFLAGTRRVSSVLKR